MREAILPIDGNHLSLSFSLFSFFYLIDTYYLESGAKHSTIFGWKNQIIYFGQGPHIKKEERKIEKIKKERKKGKRKKESKREKRKKESKREKRKKEGKK